MLEGVWRFQYGEPARPTRYWHDMLTRYISSGQHWEANRISRISLNFETPTYLPYKLPTLTLDPESI